VSDVLNDLPETASRSRIKDKSEHAIVVRCTLSYKGEFEMSDCQSEQVGYGLTAACPA
jgi:preprotein translocase subunit SecB